MYGLVNKAVEQMVCAMHGEDTWQRIKSRAGVDIEGFISNEAYPDEVTFDLVAAASEVLETPAEEILKAFGEFWVLQTALESYGPMMRATGRTIREFLLNLPHLHTRVELIYPNLKPPQFSCRELRENEMEIHYSTKRPPGLEPFVEGLLGGIGKMFGVETRVKLVAPRKKGRDASVFHLAWHEAA